MAEQLKAFWKRILSYSKKTWDIDDYPLRYKKLPETKGHHNIGEPQSWIVQVINWWTMIGLGNTKQEAFEQLKINFKSYVESDSTPRPGKNVPIKYVETTQIDSLEEIAVDFFKKIVNINYYNCYISDQSSLFDFGKDENEMLNKINSTYNLKLTEIGDGNIVRLLKIIKDSTAL